LSPQRGGTAALPCGDTRLATDHHDAEAEVPLSVYNEFSYGAYITWTDDAASINSCGSIVSLEEEDGELSAYIGTAYHCVRNMVDQYNTEKESKLALYINVASDSECQTQEGRKAYSVRVPFKIEDSDYLIKLHQKIQDLKRQDPSINMADHDRIWLEKTLNIANPDDTSMIRELQKNTKISDDIVKNIKSFNIDFDRKACTTSSLHSQTSAESSNYKRFDAFINESKQEHQDTQSTYANACFLSNDVVFFKINLDTFYLNSKSTHNCLKESHLTTQNSKKEIIYLPLNIGKHLQRQSTWNKSVISFHEEALLANSYDEQQNERSESEIEKQHKLAFRDIMQQTYKDVEAEINHGTADEEDDFKVTVYELGGRYEKYEIRLLTFYKDNNDKAYRYKNLQLNYNKNQPGNNNSSIELFGRISSIFIRHWGISLVFSNTEIKQGSSGSLLIVGNENKGYDIIAALYSKNNQEYSTSHGPIDPAYSYSRIKKNRRSDKTRPSDDDDETPRSNSKVTIPSVSPPSSNRRTGDDTRDIEQPNNNPQDHTPAIEEKNDNNGEDIQIADKPQETQQPENQKQEDDEPNDSNERDGSNHKVTTRQSDDYSISELDCR